MLLTMTQGSELHCKMDNTNDCNMYHHESIHSGHFMVSDIDDSEVQDDDDSVSVPVPDVEEVTGGVVDAPPPVVIESTSGYDFEGANKETRNTYKFGHRSSKSVSIDATLSKLFNCMTLAYSCKLTSPRWKNFKGLKLRWKDKIRLNNVIWRAWHMQFIKKKSTRICQFQSPLDTEAHIKPEAVVLEGKYWKRQTQTVRAEYKTWRLFTQKASKDVYHRRSMEWDSSESLFNWQPGSNQSAYSTSMVVDDDPFSDINDTLFSYLLPNQPIVFPNSRELAKVGIADLIQPSLVPFQPNLDDMDTFDWFSDIFSSRLPSVVEEQDNFLSDFLSGPSTSASSNTLQNNSDFPDLDAMTIRMESNLNNQLGVVSLSTMKPTATVSVPPVNNICTSSQFNSEIIAPIFQPNLNNTNMTMRIDDGSASIKMGSPNEFGLIQPSITTIDRSLVKPEQRRRSPITRQQIFSHQPSVIPSTHRDCLYTLTNQQHQIQTLQQRPPSHNLQSEIQTVPSQALALQSQCSPVSISTNLAGLLSSQYKESPISNKTFSDMIHHTAMINKSVTTPSERIQHAYVGSTESTPKIISNHIGTSNSVASTSESIELIKRLSGEQGKETGKTKKDELFAVPKTKPRSRSRSGPNLGQMLPPAHSSSSKKSQLSSSSTSIAYPVATSTQHPISIAPAPITISTASPQSPTILPQNALLARLLTVGPYQTINKSSSNKHSSPTTVTILPNTVHQPTVVMTPVSLATVSTVNDLQSRVLVGATSHVFSGMMPTGKMPIPSSSSINRHTSSSTTLLNLTAVKDSEIRHSPPSPPKSFRPKSENERVKYKEHRRVCHINAEQRRRCSIKNGFDTLHHLVPSLNQNPNCKVSKAAMLQKAGEYVKLLKAERELLQDETLKLKKQIESLNEAINLCQSQLPATGAPVPCQRPNKIQKLFDEYVRTRTIQNWKFWIFSILIRPLLETYNNTVSTASVEDMCKTVLTWLEQHCSLVALRPVVFNSLRRLSTTTNILSDPMQIQEEATKAVQTDNT